MSSIFVKNVMKRPYLLICRKIVLTAVFVVHESAICLFLAIHRWTLFTIRFWHIFDAMFSLLLYCLRWHRQCNRNSNILGPPGWKMSPLGGVTKSENLSSASPVSLENSNTNTTVQRNLGYDLGATWGEHTGRNELRTAFNWIWWGFLFVRHFLWIGCKQITYNKFYSSAFVRECEIDPIYQKIFSCVKTRRYARSLLHKIFWYGIVLHSR